MDYEEHKKGKIVLNIVIFIFLLIINFIFIMSKSINNLDEIWNYNMANQIARGLIPYKDISMVMTPFSQFLMATFLLFFNSVFTFRIIGTILATFITAVACDIVKKITQSRVVAFIFILITELLLYQLFTYDYNFLCVLLGEIALDLEISKYLKRRISFEDMINYGSIYRKAEKKTFSERHKYINYDIAIGIIAALTILTKQTVGIFMAIVVLLIPILERKFVTTKKDKKQNVSEDELYINASENNEYKIKKKNAIIARIISIICPCLIFAIYLLITHSMNDFISYTVLGIKEFSNSISYWHLIEEGGSVLISILAVVLPAYLFFLIVFLIVADKDRTINNVLKLLLLYSIPTLVLIYPIADKMHFLLGVYILLISLPFTIKFSARDLLSNINQAKVDTFYTGIAITLFMVLIVLLGKNVGESFSTLYSHKGKSSDLKHFEHLYLEDYLNKRVKETNEKINQLRTTGAEVYVLDSESALYNIVKDEYYKDYDMFNRGNFGEDGEQRIMHNIQNSHNTYYFVRNAEFGLNWQTPRAIVDEIRKYNKKGSVGLFEIYYKE